MPNPDIDPLHYHKKFQRMIKRYSLHNDMFYIFTGTGNASKSIDFIKSMLNDPKLVPYDSDNENYGN